MSDFSRKPARSRHPLIPENPVANDAQQNRVSPVDNNPRSDDVYADPMFDTPVNLQVRVPLRVRMRLEELKKRDGGSIAGHVSEALTDWLSTKGF